MTRYINAIVICLASWFLLRQFDIGSAINEALPPGQKYADLIMLAAYTCILLMAAPIITARLRPDEVERIDQAFTRIEDAPRRAKGPSIQWPEIDQDTIRSLIRSLETMDEIDIQSTARRIEAAQRMVKFADSIRDIDVGDADATLDNLRSLVSAINAVGEFDVSATDNITEAVRAVAAVKDSIDELRDDDGDLPDFDDLESDIQSVANVANEIKKLKT